MGGIRVPERKSYFALWVGVHASYIGPRTINGQLFNCKYSESYFNLCVLRFKVIYSYNTDWSMDFI